VNADDMVTLAALDTTRSGAARCADRGAFSMTLKLVHGDEIDVECRYEASGPVDAPVVIIGGGISAGRHVVSNHADDSPGWWEGQQPALADVRVLAIDWIGADGSLDCPIDPLDQATMLAHLLDELGIERAAFIGASYGAMVGQQLIFPTAAPLSCRSAPAPARIPFPAPAARSSEKRSRSPRPGATLPPALRWPVRSPC
jgi:homoserine O-acetyltransferase